MYSMGYISTCNSCYDINTKWQDVARVSRKGIAIETGGGGLGKLPPPNILPTKEIQEFKNNHI